MSLQSFHTKTLVLCGMFTALVAVGAFIQVPVPYMDYFTLQFFFVLLAGLLLGGKYGALSVSCYVLLGLMGLPVFAAGGGIGYVIKPSFGYLIGFIVTAGVVGSVCNHKRYKFHGYLTACLLGLLLTYAIGITYKYFILNYYTNTPTPFSLILASCFPLDIPGDFVLCILASLITPRLKKALVHIN